MAGSVSAVKNTNISKSFELTCLHKSNSSLLTEAIQSYVSNRPDRPENSFKTRTLRLRSFTDQQTSSSELKNETISSSSFSITDNPWWTEFTTSVKPRNNNNVKKKQSDVSLLNETYLTSFGKVKSKTSTSMGPSSTTNDQSDHFHSWLSTHTEDESTSWLGGPSQPNMEKISTVSKVEDIPVPSIYDKTPAPKGRRALKRERKAEREKTLGKKWYGMKAPDVDTKLRNDMELIRMRGVLDPKRFYKHQDRKALPKYFQMGKVVDEGTDFFSSRLTKKQRKQTLVEELMADASVRQYNKKKYNELQQKMRGKKKFKTKQ